MKILTKIDPAIHEEGHAVRASLAAAPPELPPLDESFDAPPQGHGQGNTEFLQLWCPQLQKRIVQLAPQ